MLLPGRTQPAQQLRVVTVEQFVGSLSKQQLVPFDDRELESISQRESDILELGTVEYTVFAPSQLNDQQPPLA